MTNGQDWFQAFIIYSQTIHNNDQEVIVIGIRYGLHHTLDGDIFSGCGSLPLIFFFFTVPQCV